MKKRWFCFFAFVFFELNCSAQLKTLNGKDIARIDMENFLKQQMDSLGIPAISIAVINDGKIIYHRAIGKVSIGSTKQVDDNSIFEAASLSKPVFAYFVMRMVDKGLLNLDTPLYKYMPYPDIAADERYKLITARIVLSHQTGFPNWRYFNRADSSLHIKDKELYLMFTPGTGFHYSGEGYLYLAKVIAYLNHRTLQTLDPLFQQEVAVPLDMKYAWFTANDFVNKHKISGHENGMVFGHADGGAWGHDERKNGYSWPNTFPGWDSTWFNPAAGLHTEAVSYAHFLIALINGRGLSKNSFSEMMKPQVWLPENEGLRKAYHDTSWGLGIAITETTFGTRYDHAGSNGNWESHAVIYPGSKWGFVFLLNTNRGDIFYERLTRFLMNGK
jgi:CubicO group peptidase (beta-lactamase class C family)